MEAHKPWRTVGTNVFNKDRFKGNNEVIYEHDLDTTLYIYEPQALSDLRDGASIDSEVDAEDYNQVYDKINSGGIININLVPYEEMPTMKVKITSQGGDIEALQHTESISCFGLDKLPKTTTKRIYSLTELPTAMTELPNDTIVFDEVSYSEVINTDNTIKQVSIVLKKIPLFAGGDDAFYTKYNLSTEKPLPENIKYVQFEWDGGTSALGEISIANEKNEPITKTILFNGDDMGLINSAGEIETSENYLDAHFLTKNVTDTEVKFRPLWTWEWLYAMHQTKGPYSVLLKKGQDSGSTDRPGLLPGKEDLYSFSSTDELTYTHLYTKSFVMGESGGDLMGIFGGFFTRFALPVTLSSHGALVTSSDANNFKSDAGGALLGLIGNFGSTEKEELGLRFGSRPGTWGRHSSIFLWDFAWSASEASIDKSWSVWLGDIKYGSFYRSQNYKNVLNGIVNGVAYYQGNEFGSKLGILSNIENEDMASDFQKMGDDSGNLYLLPYAIDELGGGVDNFLTENMLNQLPLVGEYDPSTDPGMVNEEIQLRTNQVGGFQGLYIEPKYFTDKDARTSKICLELNEVSTIARISPNYHGAEKLTIKFFNKDKILMRTEEYKTELAQGRSLSGGTNIIYM